MFFCVDEASQQRRVLGTMMASEADLSEAINGNAHGKGDEKSYELEWCVAALEAEQGDVGRAREWLRDRAVAKGEGIGL
jgi:hypothetical protein